MSSKEKIKLTPKSKEDCTYFCCSDCFYYNKSITFQNCPQRIQFFIPSIEETQYKQSHFSNKQSHFSRSK